MSALGRELCALLGGLFRKEISSENNFSHLAKYPVEGIENFLHSASFKDTHRSPEPS
jgi:hypothetical protein